MSSSAKKKAKPGEKKAPSRKKAKVTKTKKVVKAAAPAPKVEKAKKVSPKAKKPAGKTETPAKPFVKAPRVELGPPPSAVILARRVDSLRERAARGFSFGELVSAGVPVNAAKREGLWLDVRRRTVLDGNVEALKGWFKSSGAAPAKAVETVAVAAASRKK